MSISTPFSFGDIVIGLAFGLIVLFVVAIRMRRSVERHTILAALLVKLLASLAYNLIVIHYYHGVADTVGYHLVGIENADRMRGDLLNGWRDVLAIDPFFGPHSYSTSRLHFLSGLVHLLLFNSFIASSLLFALIGFAGQLLLYRAFVAVYPDHRIRAWWRIGILFFPSLTFWSAGILKEPLGLWGLGLTIWGVHRLLQRLSLKNIVMTAIGLYTVYLFRPANLPVLVIALIPWFLGSEYARRALVIRVTDRSAFRLGLRSGLIVVSLLGVLQIPKLDPNYSLAALPVTLVSQSSYYEESETGTPITRDASWRGLIKAAPAAIVFTLYRPFIWEASGLLMLGALIENLVLCMLSIWAIFQTFRYFSIFVKALRSPMFLTCLIFVSLFALAVGTSSPNLGTVSRYRIPLVPFWVGALTILHYHALEARARVCRSAIHSIGMRRSRMYPLPGSSVVSSG